MPTSTVAGMGDGFLGLPFFFADGDLLPGDFFFLSLEVGFLAGDCVFWDGVRVLVGDRAWSGVAGCTGFGEETVFFALAASGAPSISVSVPALVVLSSIRLTASMLALVAVAAADVATASVVFAAAVARRRGGVLGGGGCMDCLSSCSCVGLVLFEATVGDVVF